MDKKEVTKEEYKQTIDEILHCRDVLERTFDTYTTNAIDRLIIARIKLEQITIKRSVEDKVQEKQTEGQ